MNYIGSVRYGAYYVLAICSDGVRVINMRNEPPEMVGVKFSTLERAQKWIDGIATLAAVRG